jgi:hypothetical protein
VQQDVLPEGSRNVALLTRGIAEIAAAVTKWR